MDSGGKEMNPVAMTIINPRKEYWPSRMFEPATVCSQVFYATDSTTGPRLAEITCNSLKYSLDTDQKAIDLLPYLS